MILRKNRTCRMVLSFSDTDLRGSLSAGLSLPLSDKRYIATNTAMTENTPIVASIRIVLVFWETFTR